METSSAYLLLIGPATIILQILYMGLKETVD